MSYPSQNAMSPPLQKPPPLPYARYTAAGSPANASPYAPPPAKRPRLSPDPRSPPNGTVSYAASPNGLHSMGGYGNPYAQSPVTAPYSPSTFAGSPQSAFNTPQPYQPQHMPWHSQPATPASAVGRAGSPPGLSQTQSSQMMPPPPRPNKEEKDEKISADDIGDSLFGSGVNLKDEENYMHSTFNNRHTNDSFISTQTASFGSSTLSTANSFNLLTQGMSFGSGDANGAFAGTLGATLSQEEIDAQNRRRRAQLASQRAERNQYHLHNQFLDGNCVRRRLDMRARNEGVQLPTHGLYVRNVEPETRVMVNGSGNEGVVAVKPESMVEQGSQFDQLLSLVSLAANERLRGLVDEAFTLARARRYGDHGRVPPEFADIAIGEGKRVDEKVVPESITGTQWDKLPESASSPADGETTNGVRPAPAITQPSISFQGKLNAHLRALAKRDEQAEKERVRKREARRRQAENSANPDDPTAAADASAPETPTAATDQIAPISKMSKKELQKQKKASETVSEAQSHSTTNQTAAMMAMGKKTSKYSWMTKAGGAAGSTSYGTNRYAKPGGGSATGSGTVTPKIESGAVVAAADGDAGAVAGPASRPAAVNGVVEWGSWREDGVGGKGIQARDLALVLERDGREKKALQRLLNRLS